MALRDVPPERDEYGCWSHPQCLELLERDTDREYIPRDEFNAWLREHNIEVLRIDMEHDLDDEDPVWLRYFEEGGPVLSDWEPEPNGRGWKLLSIQDTEDGPVAMFYRRLTDASI